MCGRSGGGGCVVWTDLTQDRGQLTQIQGVPLATEPGISLIILTPMKILQRNTHTTDTFLFISHTTNVLLFKSRCNIVICVRIIKELPGLVSSGTPCIILTLMHLLVLLHELFIKCTDMNNISIQILQTHTRLTMDRY